MAIVMIAVLSGVVFHKNADSLVIMVGGVGYEVFVGAKTLSTAVINSKITLHTHTHVREDALQLFGFMTHDELRLFKLLLSVSGIGPKTALLVIDHGVAKVQNAVVQADVTFFTSIPRLGTKNAQKIIIELKNKLGATATLDLTSEETSGESADIIKALTDMGFSKQEVRLSLRTIPDTMTKVEEKIRWLLKELGKK